MYNIHNPTIYNTVNFAHLRKTLRCKLGTLFYTAEPIFGIDFELVQKLLANCYKWPSSEHANYLSFVIV